MSKIYIVDWYNKTRNGAWRDYRKVVKTDDIDPKREYTKAEVRSILQLSNNTRMTEKKGYIGFEGKGGILGESVIAFLPKSKKVKIGRKYPSGKVSVVSR